MHSAVRVAASCVATFVALLTVGVAPVGAARKPITGSLSKPGFTVIALAADGRATSVRALSGAFRLRPRAERVTLHLRAANGVYAGPIVIRGQGASAILGVKAGARLGRVTVRAGYARLGRRLPERWVDATRTARARHSIPIGAHRFGRVRSKPPRAAVPGDRDRDGIPDPLDIDDDGDLILDNLDRSTAGPGARAAQAGGCGPAGIYCPDVSSGLALSLGESVNVDAGSTVDAIDAAVRSHGVLRFDVGSGGRELDCGDPDTGLVYCRQNGSTGTASAGASGGTSFPGPPGGPYDADRDGFGALDSSLQGCCPHDFFLLSGARTDQIGSGDVLIEHLATGVVSTTLQYVFATVPALVRYSDTAGHSATVGYPTPPPMGDCGPSCNAPGTGGNGFPVAPGADGKIMLRLTFWRPQRKRINSDPPTAQWMDVGHLTYGAATQGPGGYCPQSSFSEDDPGTPDVVEDDPNLAPATPHLFLQGGGGFDDAKDDAQSVPGDSGPANTFSYTLNLSQCLESKGITPAAGAEQMLGFVGAPGAPSTVMQTVSFKYQ